MILWLLWIKFMSTIYRNTKIKKSLILTILIFLFSYQSFAEQNENKTEYLVLPFGYYTEATSLGFGVYSIFLFKENENKDRSRLRSDISYTLNSQIILRHKSYFFLNNSRLSIRSNVQNFISNYYGLGSNSSISNESYSFFSIDLRLDYYRKLYNEIYYALIYDLDIIDISSSKDTGILQKDGFSYEEIKFNNCIGLGLSYEKISKKFFRRGLSSNLDYIISSKLVGSANNFSVLSTDIKSFLPYKQSSLNLQFVTRFSFDDVPLTKLSTLGGTYCLRGYPDKRFMDKNMFAFQSEYDLRLYKKIAGSIFYSFGDVFDPFSDLKFNRIKQGYGLGILYELMGTAIRFDVATSPENEIQIIATGSRAF